MRSTCSHAPLVNDLGRCLARGVSVKNRQDRDNPFSEYRITNSQISFSFCLCSKWFRIVLADNCKSHTVDEMFSFVFHFCFGFLISMFLHMILRSDLTSSF